MFDLGFSELFFIAIVALIVLGPERLPKAARFAGLWMRRARTQWQSVKSEFENEIADEQLRNTLKQTRDDLREARDSVVRGSQDMEREFADIKAAARDLDKNSATPGPAQVAAVAIGTDQVTEPSPAPGADGGANAANAADGDAAAEQPTASGDNYYLEELDADPYPDGFPSPPSRNTDLDGQR